jgi:hypothetical protein
MIETIDSREESTPRDGYFPSFLMLKCVVNQVKVVNNHKKSLCMSFLYR